MIYFLRSVGFVVLLVASLTSSLYGINKGVGVLPFTLKEDGEFYCLLGRETRHVSHKPHIKYKAYSDFGGKRDYVQKIINGKKVSVLEPEEDTALREFREETGYTSFAHVTKQQIQAAPYYDAPTGYRLYFLPLDKSSWRTGQTVQKNVIAAHRQNKPHVEKDIITEVKVSDLLKAVNNPALKQGRSVAIMPKTNDQLFNLFKECLQQPAVQNRFNLQQPGAKNKFNQLIAQGKAVIKPVVPQPVLKDIVIAYHLTAQTKQTLYRKYVHHNVPGKTQPDNYHVTLGWVKDVQLKDYSLLQKHLQKIADQHLASTTFSVNALKKYVVNRHPNQSPLVFTPKANEVGKLKRINKILYNELQKYNVQYHCNYKFHKDVEISKFEPHITLVNIDYINKYGINRDRMINKVAQKIKANPFEVLRPTKAAAVKPASKKSVIKVASKKKTAPKKRTVKGAKSKKYAAHKKHTVKNRKHVNHKKKMVKSKKKVHQRKTV